MTIHQPKGSYNETPPLPEHVIDRMTKELAKYLAPLYPRRTAEWLEQLADELLRLKPIVTPWPNPTPDLPCRIYLTVTIGWFDTALKLAHIGCDDDGPTWWTEERPEMTEEERAYWSGERVF
jgi:hypothetical protein